MVGLELARGLRRRELSSSRFLALGSAPVYAGADLYAGRRFSRVYLGDLALQALFVVAWLAGTRRRRPGD